MTSLETSKFSRTNWQLYFRSSVLYLVLLTITGCGGRSSVDLLEARLRQQEDYLIDVQNQLEETRTDLNIARKESDALRATLASDEKAAILPEQANALYRTVGIEFNSYMTGGLDRDEQPGDELLSIVIQPHDSNGELLKVPGSIELGLVDLAQPKGKQTIGHWTFSSDENREQWHRGFIGSGYQYHLPWQQAPSSEKLLVHARLTTVDGRTFDSSTEIKITPPVSNSVTSTTQPSPIRPADFQPIAPKPTARKARPKPVPFQQGAIQQISNESKPQQLSISDFERSPKPEPKSIPASKVTPAKASSLPSFDDWADKQAIKK